MMWASSLQPFVGQLMDVCMAGENEIELFAEVGRLRSPFQGVAHWPWLEDALAKEGSRVLRREGKEAWKAAGGEYDVHGRASCSPSSAMATRVIEKIARGPGGMLWADSKAVSWVVKLGRRPRQDRGARYALAVNIADLSLPRSRANGGPGEADTGRQVQGEGQEHVHAAPRQLRLHRRAEQLLWLIHWAVIAQRRFEVLLPDVLLGQVIWGGDRSSWPQDWRADLLQTLRSLTLLHAQVLRLSGEGWQPRLGADSVALAHVEHVGTTRPEDDCCRPSCPMHHRQDPHTHFFVQAGWGFFGALRQFVKNNDSDGREDNNFAPTPSASSEAEEETSTRRRQKYMPSMHLPTQILGPAKWAGITPGQRAVLQAIIQEATRDRRSRRPDKAWLVQGGQVPGTRNRNQKVLCPFLDRGSAYVSFNGNGRRRGMGYRLLGENGGGWVGKCGYDVPGHEDDPMPSVRRFLADLKAVADILQLTVVAVHPRAGRWFNFEDLIALGQCRSIPDDLDQLHLRIYGPEDYLELARCYYSERGNFSMIPGGAQADADQGDAAGQGEVAVEDLRVRMQRARIRHEDLAEHLNRSRSFITLLLNGRKPWPRRLRRKAERFIARAESSCQRVEESR